MELIEKLNNLKSQGKKILAWLIDPDSPPNTEQLTLANAGAIDLILVGGSLLSMGELETSIALIKQHCNLPVILFPGNNTQISKQADGILFLSLISGRNPEWLIGQHVVAAPILKQAEIEVISTGYMLVDGGISTSVHYVTQTIPIPRHKPNLAAATALAGEYLGLKTLYLEAGSGAKTPVSEAMIHAVHQTTSIPLFVGGGIQNTHQIKAAWQAGADVVVIGSAIENNHIQLMDLLSLKNELHVN